MPEGSPKAWRRVATVVSKIVDTFPNENVGDGLGGTLDRSHSGLPDDFRIANPYSISLFPARPKSGNGCFASIRFSTPAILENSMREDDMRARLVLQMMDDDGETIATETVADLVKVTKGAEDLGLSLSEAKTLLAKLQQAMVETQVELWLRENRNLDGCRLRSKGSYPVTFHTLFGDVRLKSPRYCLPRTAGGNGPATISPLRKLIPDHIAPESLYLETRWASLVPYAPAAELLADVLPIDCGANATTVRQHALRTACRIERELTEERVSFMQDACPRDWMNLLIPDGRIVIGLDGGYIRDRNDRKKNFELIVGRSLPEDGDPRYIGFVHGHDRKPQRRILDHLKKQGVQANQDITFITDGGEEVRSLAEMIAPASEHVLDWFHITMRITVLRQFAQGLENYDEQAGQDMLHGLRRIKWHLWHGNGYRARDEIRSANQHGRSRDRLSEHAQVPDRHRRVPGLHHLQQREPDQLRRALSLWRAYLLGLR